MNQLTLRRLAPLVLIAIPAVAAGCSSNAGSDSSDPNVATTESGISNNEGTAYEFFVQKGLKDFQAAAIVGNLQQESNVDPTILQYGGGPGRGIAQWSTGGRWNSDYHDNVAWYAATRGGSEWSLNTQLDFIWYELETFGSFGLTRLRDSTSLAEATVTFQTDYEICGQCDQTNRIADAEAVLTAYGHSGGGGGGGGGGAGCYSNTLGRAMPDNACVQSRYNGNWFQCANGYWTDRWTDPAACDGVYPL